MKMSKETSQALEDSIQKWENIVKASSPSEVFMSSAYCPLCSLFYAKDCRGCPVYQKTKQYWCEDTPYTKAYTARFRWAEGKITQEQFAEIAQKEVDFLKSLRETENAVG